MQRSRRRRKFDCVQSGLLSALAIKGDFFSAIAANGGVLTQCAGRQPESVTPDVRTIARDTRRLAEKSGRDHERLRTRGVTFAQVGRAAEQGAAREPSHRSSGVLLNNRVLCWSLSMRENRRVVVLCALGSEVYEPAAIAFKRLSLRLRARDPLPRTRWVEFFRGFHQILENDRLSVIVTAR